MGFFCLFTPVSGPRGRESGLPRSRVCRQQPRPARVSGAGFASEARAPLQRGGGDTGGLLSPVPGRSGAGATSGGRRFPPARRTKRRPAFWRCLSRETGGARWGKGRRTVRPEPPAPCGKAAPAGGAPPRPPPFCSAAAAMLGAAAAAGAAAGLAARRELPSAGPFSEPPEEGVVRPLLRSPGASECLSAL